MFKKIELTNYQSFNNITLDLTGPRNKALTHAVIYGENGSGKTNLMSSISFLKNSIHTMLLNDVRNQVKRTTYTTDRNASSNQSEILIGYSKNQGDIRSLSKPLRMIDTDEPMTLRFLFEMDGSEGEYMLNFDERGLVIDESLRYRVNKRTGNYFHIQSSGDGPNMNFGNTLFRDSRYRASVEDIIRMYWGKHTLLSIFKSEYHTKNPEFMDQAIKSELGDIVSFIDSITTNIRSNGPGPISPNAIGMNLVAGVIERSELPTLVAYGNAISDFFCNLYSDMMKAEYRTVENDEGTVTYELLFWKKMAGTVRRIPARVESRGTLTLLNLLPSLMACAAGTTVFIDEMDNGIHDKLMFDLIGQILPMMRGQFVATTHNTAILESIDPQSALILRVDANGYKTITPISDITRTQKNNNNRQRYLSGQFDGVPIIGHIDINNIYDNFCKDAGER